LNATADELQGTIDALREEKKIASRDLEGMRAGVLVIDNEGRITLINPVLGRILQADLKESLGRKLIEVVRNAELKSHPGPGAGRQEGSDGHRRDGAGHSAQFEVVAVPLGETGPRLGRSRCRAA
jgi:PAS domain-containing protein